MATRDYLADFAAFRATRGSVTPFEVYREMREHIDAVVRVLDRIAQPTDCGCRPCTGQCRGEESLRIDLYEIRSMAESAAAKARSAQ